MSLINDMLSELHARDALPAGRQPLSGLRPVQYRRAHPVWLLLAGSVLFATSAWAIINRDDIRGVDATANSINTIYIPNVPAPKPVVKAAPGTEAIAGKLVHSKPKLMLDTHLSSIARLGAAWPPVRKVVATKIQTRVIPDAAEPAPVRAVAVPRVVSALPTAKPETAAGTLSSNVTKVPPKRAKTRAKNPYDTARAALADGRPQDAEAHFQQLTIDNPGDTQAWLYLARARSDQGRDADAENALMTALTVVDDPASIARTLARRLVTRNGISEALKLLEAYRPDGRLEPDHDAFIAALHQRLGRHDIAAERYREILAVRPETSAWWVGLAISEEARGHGAAALDAYHHARNLGNLDPRLADYATRRITAMQGTGSS